MFKVQKLCKWLVRAYKMHRLGVMRGRLSRLTTYVDREPAGLVLGMCRKLILCKPPPATRGSLELSTVPSPGKKPGGC